MRALSQVVDAFSRRWDSVHVELQGKYSAARLREVVAFARTSSWRRNVTIVALTPLPALLFVLFLDAMPLRSPSLGISEQTVWLYFALTAALHASPAARAGPSLDGKCDVLLRAWCIWVFPMPFGMLVLVVPFLTVHTIQMWWRWKDTLRADPAARIRLHCFLKSMTSLGMQMLTYLIYYSVFTIVSHNYRTYVSLVLPILKLAIKNGFLKGLVYLEDETPAIMVSMVDAYHSMFVCTTMQQALGLGTTTYIMLVDLAQAILAHSAIYRIARDAGRHATAKFQNDNEEERCVSNRFDSLGIISRFASSSQSRLKTEKNIVEYALHLLDTCPRVQNHPAIALPRHLHRTASLPTQLSLFPTATFTVGSINRRPSRVTIFPHVSTPTTMNLLPKSELDDELSEKDRVQLRCVQSTLRLLHAIEFYVLIEFVEVAIATTYCTSPHALFCHTNLTTRQRHRLAVLSHMPNRAFYRQFSSLTNEQLQSTVANLAIYATLELVSFVVFCAAVNRQLQHFTALQQLAFTLKKHWKIVAPSLALHVMIVAQLTFEHFGMDYTFKFEWMQKPQHV